MIMMQFAGEVGQRVTMQQVLSERLCVFLFFHLRTDLDEAGSKPLGIC